MEDLDPHRQGTGYKVDVKAVADSIVRQLCSERTWIKFPELVSLDSAEVFVSLKAGNFKVRSK